jgi:hypothetical protein
LRGQRLMPVNRMSLEGEMPLWRQLAWFEPENSFRS